MSVLSNLSSSGRAVLLAEAKSDRSDIRCRGVTRISTLFKDDRFEKCQLASMSRGTAKYPNICMALVDERRARSRDMAKPPGVLAYDLVQGALVRWSSTVDKSLLDPPTAVLLHGILGCRKNWGVMLHLQRSTKIGILKEVASYVDLPCH